VHQEDSVLRQQCFFIFTKEDDNDESKKNVAKQNNSKTSFNYSRIPYGSNAHLLSIPLGKPLHFDGEDYSW
jgi:hypothetical protein